MKFAVSYSCGKDSTLALHKMLEQGHEPVCLVVMVKEDEDRSYFHGADRAMLEQYVKALAIPVITCPAEGATYHTAFERGLSKAKAIGAEAVCFGDIDIEQNRRWEEERCKAVGLFFFFPLWRRKRKEIVYEVIRLNYRCLIKSINRKILPMDLLGTVLTEASVLAMESAGIDICGENGEYHTLAIDGPIFREPLVFQIGDKIEIGDYAVADIYL